MTTATTKKRKARDGGGASLTSTPLRAPRLRQPPSPQQVAAACFTEATPVTTRTTSTIASKKTPNKVDSRRNKMPYLTAGVAETGGGTNRPTVVATHRR